MSRFNITLFCGAILLLAALIISMIIFVRKVKRGWLYLISFFLIMFSVIFIRHRIVHATFRNFNKEVCETYQEIEKLKLVPTNQGQICRIYVYLKKDEDAETVERLFIELMKRVNQEPLSTYLKESADYDWLNIQIHFLGADFQSFNSEQYQRADWFTEENQKVQTWEEDDTHKKYVYWDYKD